MSKPSTTTVAGVHTPLKLTGIALIECGQNRISSRSVSWSATGASLSMACSDRCARIWAIEPSGGAREVSVVTGHTAAVTKTRFHPTEASLLCTAAIDLSVRLWDVRAAPHRGIGKIDLAAYALSVEWCLVGVVMRGSEESSAASLLTVTDRNGIVAVYDTRKLPTPAATTTASSSSAGGRPAPATTPLRSFSMKPYVPETSVFSPQGTHLVTGATVKGEGVGEIRIWPWKKDIVGSSTTTTFTDLEEDNRSKTAVTSYPAHCGPIYALQFSPDGRRLASGGSDSNVCLWDVASMCCIHSLAPRRTKLICGVAFSHDTKLLAACSGDDGIDLMDAETGGSIGVVSLSHRPREGGAEEVAFHPEVKYLLACARMASGALPVAPVTVAKLSISSSNPTQ